MYIFQLCIVIQWVSEVITYQDPRFLVFFQPKTTVLQPLLTFSNIKNEILPTELLQSLLNCLKTKDRVDVMTS